MQNEFSTQHIPGLLQEYIRPQSETITDHSLIQSRISDATGPLLYPAY